MNYPNPSTKTLSDGTQAVYCNPHRRWEWDCKCGHVNSTRAKTCEDCGVDRKTGAER